MPQFQTLWLKGRGLYLINLFTVIFFQVSIIKVSPFTMSEEGPSKSAINQIPRKIENKCVQTKNDLWVTYLDLSFITTLNSMSNTIFILICFQLSTKNFTLHNVWRGSLKKCHQSNSQEKIRGVWQNRFASAFFASILANSLILVCLHHWKISWAIIKYLPRASNVFLFRIACYFWHH